MKYNLYLIAGLFLLNEPALNAQNLVPNNSFETNIGMPINYGDWSKCNSWNDVNMYPNFAWPYASPDYLHANASVTTVKLPNTTFGTVNAYTGSAVFGFVTWLATTADFREYLSIKLTSPLVVGQLYEVSFYVTNGTNTYSGSGANGLGVNFSSSALTQATHEHINVTPQCESTSQIWNTGWQKVTFYYTATAAFQYITIGNFRTDANTSHTYHGPGQDGAYYFIDEVVVQVSTPLPLELISFTGLHTELGNVLSWKTLSEINTDFFSIEKSLDGTNFYETSQLNAKGNFGDQSEYSLTDDSNLHAIDYYRLKMVDHDGSFTYSNIIVLKSSEQKISAQLLGNPFSDNLLISCESTSETSLLYEVYNTTGQLMYRSKLQNIYGSSKFDINSQAWPDGIYIVSLLAGDKKIILKSVKHSASL